MSIKVVYDKFSDVCKHYSFGKKLLDEPEKIVDRLNEHYDGVEFGQFDGCNPDNVYIKDGTITLKDKEGQLKVLPNTGTASTIFTTIWGFVGLLATVLGKRKFN